MADAAYQPGDPVRVYGSPFNATIDQGGFDATIVRRMPEAVEGEFYEVQYVGDVPEGTAVILAAPLLRRRVTYGIPDRPAEP